MHNLEEIKTISQLGNIRNKLEDGESRYPQDVPKPSSGMEVKFQLVSLPFFLSCFMEVGCYAADHSFVNRNVSFAYPKSETVIKDASFTIGKGQAVVIVGINGSGKSTLLKLFNRLYDPTSGTISIDGTPLGSFVASDVRQSMAMLSQNYTHYPLSIRENISLGLPDGGYGAATEVDEKKQLLHDDLVKEAARLGGATDIIGKQLNGFDAVLRPSSHGYSTSSSRGGEAFRDKMKEISKEAEVSLGQWQRLAL